MPAERIDPAVLIPQGVVGKATNFPEFFDEVIGAINDHADRIDDGGSGGVTSFRYEVVGDELDLSELIIMLPSARADTEYTVTPAQETATYVLGMHVADASKATDHFTLSLTANATAGDVFVFIVATPSS